MHRLVASLLVLLTLPACSSKMTVGMMSSSSEGVVESCDPSGALRFTTLALTAGSSSECPSVSPSSVTAASGSGPCVPTLQQATCSASFDCTETTGGTTVTLSGVVDSSDQGATFTGVVDGLGCTYDVAIAPAQ